jgi:hypothetical protein
VFIGRERKIEEERLQILNIGRMRFFRNEYKHYLKAQEQKVTQQQKGENEKTSFCNERFKL